MFICFPCLLIDNEIKFVVCVCVCVCDIEVFPGPRPSLRTPPPPPISHRHGHRLLARQPRTQLAATNSDSDVIRP